MIDIVLATHDGERHLPVLLESIRRQTLPPARLIAVDDCSSDATREQLVEFAATVDFEVDVISTATNAGSAAAFARGIERARSAVVAFCDQDDRWHPHKLSRVDRAWTEAAGATMIVSDVSLADEDLQPLGRTFWEAVGFDPPPADASRADVLRALLRGGRIPGMAMTMSRDVALRAGPPAPGWHHDGWYSLVAASMGTVEFLREPLVDYRLHAGQQTAPGTRQPWRLPPSERARRFSAGATRFASLADRLAQLGADEWVIHTARDKSRFLQERAEVALQPTLRPSRILSSLRAGRYRRYATPVGAIGDLLGLSRPRPYVG